MKKQIFNRIFWAFVALCLCALVCVQWFSIGCGWQSIVVAAMFYCALCFGGYVVVDDILKGRRQKHEHTKDYLDSHNGGIVTPNKQYEDFITRSETVVDIDKLKDVFEKEQQKQ